MKKALHWLALVKVCVIAVLFLGFGSVAFSQTLWQTTKSGMSVDAVKKLFPKAVSAESPSAIANHGLLRLDNQTLAGLLFDVTFSFMDNRLESVMLRCKEKSEKYSESVTLSIEFDNLREILRAKYGTPFASKKDKTSWLSGKTEITLTFLDAGSGGAMLYIIYQTQLAEKAGDL